MKQGIFIFMVVSSLVVTAQHSFIEPDNPLPRAGEKINLQITLQRNDLTLLEQKTSLSPAETERLKENYVAGGSLKISYHAGDTGLLKVGPFTFAIANALYTTNEITLRVRPALPASVREGIWVNVIRFQDHYYIVLEQRIPTALKRDPNNPNTLRLNTDDISFANLNTDKLLPQGLEFVSSSVSTDNLPAEITGTGGGVAYKRSSYKFKILRTFRGHVKIDRSYFQDLPKGARIEIFPGG